MFVAISQLRPRIQRGWRVTRMRPCKRVRGRSAARSIRCSGRAHMICNASVCVSIAMPAFQTSRGNASSNSKMDSAVPRFLDFSTLASQKHPMQVERRVIGRHGALRIPAQQRSGKECGREFSKGTGSPSELKLFLRNEKVRLSNRYRHICTIASFAKSLRCVSNQYLLTSNKQLGNHATSKPANQGRHGLRDSESQSYEPSVQKICEGFPCLPARKSRQRLAMLQGRGGGNVVPQGMH